MNQYRQQIQYPSGGGTVGREQRGFTDNSQPTIQSKPGQSQVSPEMSKMMGKALRNYMATPGPTGSLYGAGSGLGLEAGAGALGSGMVGTGAGGSIGTLYGSSALGAGAGAGVAGSGAGGAVGSLYGAGSGIGALGAGGSAAGAGAGAGLGSAAGGGMMAGASAVAWPLAIAAALHGADEIMNEKGKDKWYSREKLNSLGSRDGKGIRLGDGLNMINPATWLSDPSKAMQSAGNFLTFGLFD